MSGAACVIIIDDAKKLANTAATVVTLYEMEMAREVTIPERQRSDLREALENAEAAVRAALAAAIQHAGEPHDEPLRKQLAKFLKTQKA